MDSNFNNVEIWSTSNDDKSDVLETTEEVSQDGMPFSDYVPGRLAKGTPHPVQLIEGSALVCVDPPPTNLYLRLPRATYAGETAFLSAPQVEAIIYASQAHEGFITINGNTFRRGFFLGDGTGTGKTRVLSGIVIEGRRKHINKAIWVTANRELVPPIEKEIELFGETILIQLLREVKETYLFDDGILVLTYAELSDVAKQRKLQKIIGANFNGYLIFDEAHYGKGAESDNPSKTGVFMVKLQELYPQSRVVYASATGASETYHIMCMTRLGLWGSHSKFQNKEEFRIFHDRHGLPGLELLAMEMKRQGVFLSRQISFKDIHVEVLECKEAFGFEEMYRKSCHVWLLLLQFIKSRNEEEKVINKTLPPENRLNRSSCRLRAYFQNLLNFFSSIIMSTKIEKVAEVTMEKYKSDMSVVIGYQSTGEAGFDRTQELSSNNGMPFSNAANFLRMTMQIAGIPLGCPKIYKLGNNKEMYEKLGTWSDKDERKANKDVKEEDLVDNLDEAYDISQLPQDFFTNADGFSDCGVGPPLAKKSKTNPMTQDYMEFSVGAKVPKHSHPSLTWTAKTTFENLTARNLARLYHELYLLLPVNPVDELVSRLLTMMRDYTKNDQLKVTDFIANGTGQRELYFTGSSGKPWEVALSNRKSADLEDFMNKTKRICLISDASSVGVSLHSAKDCKNQQQRYHITLQYSWSPEKVVQQLGRTHRSNQICAPIYAILTSPVASEARFVSIVAKRLAQMGAICHGQKQANILSDKLPDVICTSVGLDAIRKALTLLSNDPQSNSIVRLVEMGVNQKFEDSRNPSSSNRMIKTVSGIFNKLMLFDLDIQRNILDAIIVEIENCKNTGRIVYSPIIEYPNENLEADIRLESTEKYKLAHGREVSILRFHISRVLTWDILKQRVPDFAAAKLVQLDRLPCCVVPSIEQKGMCLAYYPFSRTPARRPLSYFNDWENIDRELAFRWHWNFVAGELDEEPGCFHSSVNKIVCKDGCMYKFGSFTLDLICGSVYHVIDLVLPVFKEKSNQNNSFQVARVTYTERGFAKSIVGMIIENKKAESVKKVLCEEVAATKHKTLRQQ